MEEKDSFEKLKKVLSAVGKGLEVKTDSPNNYYLNTNKEVKGKEMFFGAVQIRKSYVAYHLFPVYTNPELLDELPNSLKKRMQGKSCFNFKKDITDEQLTGINELTKSAYNKFLEIGYIDA